MHEPLRTGSVGTIDPLAIEPEPPPVVVFHDVIITFRRDVPAPPFRRNALRPLGAGHLMHDAPPVELPWRPLREEGDDMRGFWLHQQELRTQGDGSVALPSSRCLFARFAC